MQVKKQQLEPDMEQQTGSKSGKGYVKAVYCHPAYLASMQSTSWETLGWKQHKLESRLLGQISITSDMQMTPPLRRKGRTKEPLDESERGEWKSWLDAQHSENEDHGIRSHHFMANRWRNSGNSVRLYFSVQFSSVAQSCLTLCHPMNRSTPGLPHCRQVLKHLSHQGSAEYIMRNTGLEEAQAGIKIAGRNINNLR